MVQPFAPAYEKPLVAKWQISTAGGAQPRWRGDGKELYYMAPDGKLMAVEVKATSESFEHGTPQALFQSRADAPTGRHILELRAQPRRQTLSHPYTGRLQPPNRRCSP